MPKSKNWVTAALLVIAVGVGGWLIWRYFQPKGLPEGFASGNGRIEGTEVDGATKLAGRVAEILVNEGDFVTAGQVVAQVDTTVLEAQLAQAKAQLRQAQNAQNTAALTVTLRESEKATAEVSTFAQGYRASPAPPVGLALRARFNPTLTRSWFGAVVQVINNVTMLSIVLVGAALIRERERGTIEHLLVMPVKPVEIMTSKVWSMGLLVLAASAFSLSFIVQGLLSVPIRGSVALFLAGTALHLFATTSMGIFMGTVARSMPQFGILLILVLLPLQMLSGGQTPRESMPEFVQYIMLVAPTTHYVMLAQAILYRGAGIEAVWQNFVWLAAIGGVLFGFSLARLRKSLSEIR